MKRKACRGVDGQIDLTLWGAQALQYDEGIVGMRVLFLALHLKCLLSLRSLSTLSLSPSSPLSLLSSLSLSLSIYLSV